MSRSNGIRRILAPFAALALLAGACAPGGDTSSDSTNGDRLRMTVWTGNKDHLALFNEIADAFVAQHGTVKKVDFDVLPVDNYTDALTVQLAGGNPPDLGWIFERNAPEFIHAGVLTDVAPALRDDAGYKFDDLGDSTLKLWQDGNALYAYPFSTSPQAIFYNADMFDKAGLDNPDELHAAGKWTWEALRQAGAQVVAKGVAPHGFVIRDFNFTAWNTLATVWRGFGADAWSQDGTRCGFTDPKMVDAMTFFHSAVFNDRAHPGPGQSADFFAGNAAMTVTQISRAALLEKDGFKWGIVPLPAGPAGAQQVVGQAGIGVFKSGKNQQAAIQFLRHMTNEENSRKLARFFPPPRESLLTADVLAESNPWLSKDQLNAVVVQGIANGSTMPTHVNFTQLLDAIRPKLDALWTKDADVKVVMQQVCAVADPLLKK